MLRVGSRIIEAAERINAELDSLINIGEAQNYTEALDMFINDERKKHDAVNSDVVKVGIQGTFAKLPAVPEKLEPGNNYKYTYEGETGARQLGKRAISHMKIVRSVFAEGPVTEIYSITLTPSDQEKDPDNWEEVVLIAPRTPAQSATEAVGIKKIFGKVPEGQEIIDQIWLTDDEFYEVLGLTHISQDFKMRADVRE